MGLFDKIKEKAQQIKEENKNLGQTTKRMNNKENFFGFVNRGVDGGDFWKGSYVNFEAGRMQGSMVIYSAKEDDYWFSPSDVVSFEPAGTEKFMFASEMREFPVFKIAFKDGKTARLDILSNKTEQFVKLVKG